MIQLNQSTIKVSNCNKDRLNVMHFVRQKLLDEGLSKESTNIIMSAWRENISKKYNFYIKRWEEF